MKKGYMVFLLSIIFLAGCFVFPSFAGDDVKKTAVSMVEEAVKLIQQEGREKACAVINDPSGRFVKGDIYVFVYDLNGVIVAHPKNHDIVGKNMLNISDVNGKYFRKDIISIAKRKNSGWVDYTYRNPDTKIFEQKTTYVVGFADLAICCGVYKK
jgi:signal transduction histidine kinase